MKKFIGGLIFLSLLLFPCISYAATYTAVAAGGNWNAVATWGGGGYPIAGDTANIDATMTGTVTVNTNSACKVLNLTGNGGTLAFGNYAITIDNLGSVTLGGTVTSGTTGLLSTSGNTTFDFAGVSFPGQITLTSATFTLSSALTCTGILNIPSTNVVFSGAFNISCATLRMALASAATRTLTLVAGQTLTVTTNLYLNGREDGTLKIVSGTGSSDTNLTYQGTAANCKVFAATFTDVNASTSAQGIDNWYGKTLTRTTNITNRTSADIGGGGSTVGYGYSN